MMLLTTIYALFGFFASVAFAIPNCCNGNSTIATSKRCSDGSNVTLTCEQKFYMSNNTNEKLQIDHDGNLVIDSDYYPPTEYCYSKSKSNKDVFLVCFTEDTFEDNKRIFVSIFQLISIISFFITISIYLTIPEMMDLQGLCKVHSMFGLMVAYIALVRVNLATSYIYPIECHLIAYTMYAGFLYAFFWLNILCFHLWRHVINPSRSEPKKKLLIIYHIYGVGGPLVCLMILVLIHHWKPASLTNFHPGIGENRCWFKTPREAFIYFYTPVTILLTMNVIFFICTARVLWKQLRTCRQTKILKYRWKLYVKLFFIMGISWIFEIISATMESQKYMRYLWLTTDIINSLQGLIIFLILVVFRKRVLRALANNKFLKRKLPLPTEWKYLQDSECEELEADTEIPMQTENTKI